MKIGNRNPKLSDIPWFIFGFILIVYAIIVGVSIEIIKSVKRRRRNG